VSDKCCRRLFAEFGDTMREPRDFSAGIVLVHDTSLCCPHDDGFCRLKGRQGGFAIAALDRFLDLAYRISQHRAPSLIDFGSARDHARGFAGGLGIGHQSLIRGWRLERTVR